MYLSSLASRLNRDFNVGFHAFSQWEPELDRIFADVSYSITRHFDLQETETGYKLSVELPGFKSADLDVTIERDQLVVKAKRGEKAYSGSVTLPEDVDADKTEAKLEDGVLVISLQRSELVKPRKVEIKSA